MMPSSNTRLLGMPIVLLLFKPTPEIQQHPIDRQL